MTVIFTLLGLFEGFYYLDNGGNLALMLTISFFTNAYMAYKIENK